MKVEIWSDYVCPFCYIGKRRFEQALSKLPYKEKIEVELRSFELDPSAPVNAGKDLYDTLAAKFGIPREQAIAMNRNVDEMAKGAGLTYVSDTRVMTNTFDAHRLTLFAKERGLSNELGERLLRAHFTESRDLGDREALTALAAEVGLDAGEAREALESGAYAEAVRAEEQEAAELGVRGVPFFVIDRKYGVSGAQSVETFERALNEAWGERGPLTVLNGESEGDACGAGDMNGVCAPSDKK
ncbi:DsbA family oxidoreductase [Paenibacillus sp. TRM 82003]|nr:DsbA family oxidoreductase [Paenibacillus sp. TRM 82003]